MANAYFAVANSVVLGQRKVKEGTNEITALPELLDALYIKGCIITVDAICCQKAIAQKILDQGADYVLALKGNTQNLYKSI